MFKERLPIIIISTILSCALVAKASAQTTSFYVYDRPNRSVTGITDTNGNILNKYAYDAFGQISSRTETIPNEFSYVGERLDAKTNLIFLRNRYYDPALGRFTTKDPHPGFNQVPQTKNPYPYCNNNPVNLSDPNGQDLALIVVALIGAATWGWYNEAMSALRAGGDYADINNAGALGALGNVIGAVVAGGAVAVSKNPFLSGALGSAVSSNIRQQLTGNYNFGSAATSALFSGFASQVLSQAIPLKAPGWLNVWSPRDLSSTVGMDSVRYVGRSLLSPTFSNLATWGYNALTSGFNILNLFSGFFGGVSLSKTADLMLNIQDVGGAKFDEATGQVILYGRRDVALPDMKLDDLSVAISSVYGLHKSAEDPGVSIDPDPLNPAQMKVRYDGDTKNTAFGNIMFDSDRLLKTLVMGKDNITGAAVSSGVIGYKNLLERVKDGGAGSLSQNSRSTRMWFTPKDIKLIQSLDGSAMMFDTATMQLLTEEGFQQHASAGPAAEAFALHFTQNYDAFAGENQVLWKLTLTHMASLPVNMFTGVI